MDVKSEAEVDSNRSAEEDIVHSGKESLFWILYLLLSRL
jgi:hypothetical protein